MKIHTILNKEGTIDAKLFGEWRVKSYLIIALSCVERDDVEGASAVLKKAKTVAMDYIEDIKSKKQFSIGKEESSSLKGLTSQLKEVRRLMANCAEKNKETKRLEKKRAQAMFSSKKDLSNNIKSKKAENITANKEGALSETLDNSSKDGPTTSPVLKSLLNDKSSDRPSVRKSVSFSQKPPQVKEFDSTNEDVPWYSEHKEALVLMALTSFSVLAFTIFKKRA